MRPGDPGPTSANHIEWFFTLLWLAVCCFLYAYLLGLWP